MSKPIYWAIGAGLALAIVWVALRMDEPLPAAPAPASSVAAQSVAPPATLQPADVAAADPVEPKASATPTAARAVDSALPIDVTPGFDLLNTKASSLKDTDPTKPLLLRHEELQAQPRDPAWSEPMEAALRKGFEDSLTARGLDTHRVDLPVVECRATGCEIQAIGFREDIAKPGVGFQSVVAALLMGPLNSELDKPHGTMRGLPDGRVSYIMLLGRRGK